MLAARYADLVWDTTRFVTKGRPSIEFARLAIDSYIAAIQRDDGTAWGDNFYNLKRVLQLALSVRDEARTALVVQATIDYADRTAEDAKIGTYCYLFDNLLPQVKGPQLSDQQEQKIVKLFESKFVEMTRQGGQWDADPHSPRDIGLRLASYYRRKGRHEDRQRIMEAIARAFERRAKIGNAMSGLMFLDDAAKFFLEAGMPAEAARVQRESQELAPDAKLRMTRHTFQFEIPNEDRDRFLASLVEHGLDQGLHDLVVGFVPNQAELQQELESLAEQYPLQAMFHPMLLGDQGIKANVQDVAGDPDGRMAFETARRLQLNSIWLSWGFDHLIENGLTAERIVDFNSPLFAQDRLPLIRRAAEAHIVGDYVQAIHLLVPQIERAIVGLIFLLGGPSTKSHRSGRAVMQAKSLNDALDDETVRQVLGSDLRMYLIATLSHPKGMNIRNQVCHGLWPPAAFNKTVSERVIHVLLSLSLLRKRKNHKGGSSDAAQPKEEVPAE